MRLLRKRTWTSEIPFSEGFYFDSIHSTAWIKDASRIPTMLVDGLKADIAMKGNSADLVCVVVLIWRAVVALEISATVGVAAAFLPLTRLSARRYLPPVKVLGPLGGALSPFCDIALPVRSMPQTNEVLRQPIKRKPARFDGARNQSPPQ